MTYASEIAQVLYYLRCSYSKMPVWGRYYGVNARLCGMPLNVDVDLLCGDSGGVIENPIGCVHRGVR